MHQISNTVIKSPDWKTATVGNVANVSINRVNKKGEVFPNFDGVVDGATIAGDLWQSSTGKWYLFAPKQGNLGTKPQWAKDPNAIVKAQERKETAIHNAQENKGEAIMLASTIRMAVDITVARMAGDGTKWTIDDIQNEIENWRKHFISIWNPNVE